MQERLVERRDDVRAACRRQAIPQSLTKHQLMGLPRSTSLRTLREGSAYTMTGKKVDAPDLLLAKVVKQLISNNRVSHWHKFLTQYRSV